ncbi:MAG: ECF transporter S component [Clostridia bacterium]
MKENKVGDKRLLGSIHPAVIAVWAAVIAASCMLPSIPLLGTGGTFSIATALVPLAGVLFGPIGGAICAAIGGFIGQLIAPHIAWMGLATFSIGVINAFCSGLISRGKWPYAVGVLGIGTVLWFSTATGRAVPLFAIVFYGAGLLVTVVGGMFAKKWLLGKNIALKTVAVWICSFAGLVGAASIANYFALTMFQTPAEVWTVLTVMSPIERTIFAVGSAIVGVPLLVGLPKIGIFVGPQTVEVDDEE